MKRPRPKPGYTVEKMVYDLVNEFRYPDVDTHMASAPQEDRPGMAHVLIVSTSEPLMVQRKADFVVPATNSAVYLQDVFNQIGAMAGSGRWSIWMAGQFNLEADVVSPPGAWIRGLGYTHHGYPV